MINTGFTFVNKQMDFYDYLHCEMETLCGEIKIEIQDTKVYANL